VRGPWLESFNPRGVAPMVLHWSFSNPGPTPSRELDRVCFALEKVADPRPHLWDPDLRRWREPEWDE